MKITTIFKDDSDIYLSGLTPKISINNITNYASVTHEITSGSMTDLGLGFYGYDFTTYSEGNEYSIYIDANDTIENRYQYGTIDKVDDMDLLYDLNNDIESDLGIKEMLRIMFAVLANRSNGGNTNTISFRDYNNSKNRIVATVDDFGDRSAVVIDAT
jgi:hypothetical protein